MRLVNIFALAALVGITGCGSREEARRKEVAANLKQIELALDAYHAKQKELGAKEAQNTTDQAPVKAAPQAEGAERQADKAKKVSGEVAELHRSPAGEVDGLTLKDGTEVRFPPKAGDNVAAAVSIGDQVEIAGWTHAGESEVHAATITNVGSGKALDVDQPPPGVPE
jgi:hypothetical protein